MIGCGAVQGAPSADPASSSYVSASAAKLNFGTVVVGSSQTLITTVTNNSRRNITIQKGSVSGPGFSLISPALPLTIGARQSLQFTIQCAPNAAGALTGSLVLTTTASSPTAAVALSGTAVLPGQLSPAPASLSFGSVPLGQAAASSATLTNSGSTSLTISQLSVNNSAFQLSGVVVPLTLAPGQSASLGVAFKPQAAGAASGTISANTSASLSAGGSNSANAVTVSKTISIPLSGTATAAASAGVVSANPASLSFGSVQAGSSKSQTETLSNTGGSTVTISQANVTGSGFSLSGLDLPLSLNAGQSFTFGVLFAPQAGGSAVGSIALVSTASSAPSVPLSGTGIAAGQLTISPATLSFGNVTVGASQSLSATLTAAGAGITLSSASVSSSEFTLTGLSLPLTLAAGQSAPVTVQFTPQASGTASASASFTSNASAPTVTETLAGTGVAAPQHSVALSWSAIAAAAGYNVYRGSVTGGPYSKLTSSPEAATSYSDTSVLAGQTYFYVTTAVDSSGTESDYSNEVQAVVPTP